jgi:small GTP-binding protein
MTYIKLVITGPFNAGKTAFIETVNEIRGVNTDVAASVNQHIKPNTTVAMDFGRITLPDGLTIHLVGTPGQERFAFMWEALVLECDGILLLVDSSDPASLTEASKMIEFFTRQAPGVPIFIVANKQDRPGALRPDEIGRQLRLATLPLSCVASNRASVIATLQHIAPYLINSAMS